MIQVGRHAAKGMVLELWTTAQKFWLTSRGRGIPKPVWIEYGLPQNLIDCRLARDDGDFIYAIGSKDQFKWLNQRSSAGSENKGKSNERRETESNGRKRNRSSSSSSSSSSDSISISKPKSTAGVETPRSSEKNIPTWEAYRAAYLKRYGEPPVRNASVNSKIKQFVNRIGAEEAPLVAEFYLTHNDRFYVQTMHTAGSLLRDAEKLRTEWATGNKMLGTIAIQAERIQHNSDVWDRAAELVNKKIREGKNGTF